MHFLKTTRKALQRWANDNSLLLAVDDDPYSIQEYVETHHKTDHTTAVMIITNSHQSVVAVYQTEDSDCNNDDTIWHVVYNQLATDLRIEQCCDRCKSLCETNEFYGGGVDIGYECQKEIFRDRNMGNLCRWFAYRNGPFEQYKYTVHLGPTQKVDNHLLVNIYEYCCTYKKQDGCVAEMIIEDELLRGSQYTLIRQNDPHWQNTMLQELINQVEGGIDWENSRYYGFTPSKENTIIRVFRRKQ